MPPGPPPLSTCSTLTSTVAESIVGTRMAGVVPVGIGAATVGAVATDGAECTGGMAGSGAVGDTTWHHATTTSSPTVVTIAAGNQSVRFILTGHRFAQQTTASAGF